MLRKTFRSGKIAVIGYGSQGRAIALNLRDSGYHVVLGLRRGSRSRKSARADGFQQVQHIPQAVAQADVTCFAFPDHLHGRVFKKEIEKHLVPNSTLWFLHGMSIHFRFVTPPEDCDVILIAPHAPGVAVREKYLNRRTYSAFSAIFQDVSGNAKKTTSALARAMGIPQKNLVATTFEHEALGDMFGEQAVLCGGLAALIKNGFEVLVENGIPPENAYLEVAYQLDLIVDLIKRHGLEGMLKRISVAARYGSLQAGPKIINSSVKKRMQQVFREIQSDKFSRRLSKLRDSDIARLNQAVKNLSTSKLEKAARKFAP